MPETTLQWSCKQYSAEKRKARRVRAGPSQGVISNALPHYSATGPIALLRWP